MSLFVDFPEVIAPPIGAILLSGLEIDIVYEWELGSLLIFDRTRLHCSSSIIDGKKIGLTTFTKK